jgi:hypothetical protein
MQGWQACDLPCAKQDTEFMLMNGVFIKLGPVYQPRYPVVPDSRNAHVASPVRQTIHKLH